ncbi:hypothetical protein U1Q18_005677 [Sarracenia purpurea var. burkii]
MFCNNGLPPFFGVGGASYLWSHGCHLGCWVVSAKEFCGPISSKPWILLLLAPPSQFSSFLWEPCLDAIVRVADPKSLLGVGSKVNT